MAALLVLLALLAPNADAKLVRYSGESEQGMKVVLETNARGRAQYLAIHFRPRCRHGEGKFRQRFVAPFRHTDWRGFVDGGRLTQKFNNVKTIGKVRTHVEGERIDGEHLRGSFDYQVRYFLHGDRFNACKVRDVEWAVTRKG